MVLKWKPLILLALLFQCGWRSVYEKGTAQHILFHKAEVRDLDTSSCEMEGQRISGRRVLQSLPKSLSAGARGSFAISSQGWEFTASL